jgi:Flp pilus assembly protein protease CpaA
MADALTLLFLPALVYMGIFSTIEDVKHHRIRNFWILLSLAYSVIIVVVMWTASALLTFLSHMVVPLQAFLLNILFSSVLGAILWYMKMLSAGDAKLFIAYALLISPTLSSQQTALFPGLVLLMNVVMPYFIYYLAKILLKTSWKEKKHAFLEIASVDIFFSYALSVFAFLWMGHKFSSTLSHVAPTVYNPFTSILFVLIIIFTVKDIASLSLRKFCIGVSLFALLVDYRVVFSTTYLTLFLVVFLSTYVVRGFVLNLSYAAVSHPIWIENLKAGMLPAENFIRKGAKTYKKIKILPLGIGGGMLLKGYGAQLIASPHEGITQREAAAIKRLHSEGAIQPHTIRVYEHLPFAPFLLAGTILTLLMQGNVVFSYF